MLTTTTTTSNLSTADDIELSRIPDIQLNSARLAPDNSCETLTTIESPGTEYDDHHDLKKHAKDYPGQIPPGCCLFDSFISSDSFGCLPSIHLFKSTPQYSFVEGGLRTSIVYVLSMDPNLSWHGRHPKVSLEHFHPSHHVYTQDRKDR